MEGIFLVAICAGKIMIASHLLVPNGRTPLQIALFMTAAKTINKGVLKTGTEELVGCERKTL